MMERTNACEEVWFDSASHRNCGLVEIRRPPHNYFTIDVIRGVIEGVERVAADPGLIGVVIASEGKNFCAGRDFAEPRAPGDEPGDLYDAALKLFDAPIITVAAVQGAAVGGGLGLALAADFRVASTLSRFHANFVRLGYAPGFALSRTLSERVGRAEAMKMLFGAARLYGTDAFEIGLCDILCEPGDERSAAFGFVESLLPVSPSAVRATKRLINANRNDDLRLVVGREAVEQERLRGTPEFVEGTRASKERREPDFISAARTGTATVAP